MEKTETGTEALGREISRAEFLGLTPEDEVLIAIRLALHRKLKPAREAKGLTQSPASTCRARFYDFGAKNVLQVLARYTNGQHNAKGNQYVII